MVHGEPPYCKRCRLPLERGEDAVVVLLARLGTCRQVYVRKPWGYLHESCFVLGRRREG